MVNNATCTSCIKYWSCKKPDKRLGNICEDYLTKSNATESSTPLEAPSTLNKAVRSYPPIKKLETTKIITNLEDEDDESIGEDYSNYFTSTKDLVSLPEQDFPQAKNVFEFVFGRKFLDQGATGLYARQLGLALNFFTEYCPVCSDTEYLRKNFEVDDSTQTILERVVLLEYDTCPKCKKTKLEFIKEGKLWDNWEFVGLLGQRAGKSLLASIFSAYTLHKFLKLKSVASTFGVAKPTIFLGTFVALDKSQIQDSTWGYLQNLIKGSPWFTSYTAMLKDYERRVGRKLVDVDKVETIEFYHKNIKLNMAAPRPGALRGRTGFLGVVDEIGHLKVKDGEGRVVTADEVYSALNNRMGTLVTSFERVRLTNTNVPVPIFINISSPAHSRDKICSLVKDIKTQEASIGPEVFLRRYAAQYPTWEVNPMFPRQSSYIVSKFKTDPKNADRDFGANAPLSENSFIEDVTTLRSNFLEHTNLINIDYTVGDRQTNYTVKYLKTDFDRTIPRVLAMDLGFNNNSTAISIGYYDETLKIIKTEVLAEIIPTAVSEINFPLFVEKVLKPLIQDLNIQIVSADRWQSINMLQELEQLFSIKAVTYSLKYSDIQHYKQSLMNNKSTYPKPEDDNLLISCDMSEESYPVVYHNKPISHFFFQCLTVVDDKDKAVRKGEKTTDDLFRANALMHYLLSNIEYRDLLKQSKLATVHYGPSTYVASRNGALTPGTSTRFSGKTVVVA